MPPRLTRVPPVDSPPVPGSAGARDRSSAPEQAARGTGVAGAAALAAEYADHLVLGTVRDVHRAVADRTFATAGLATRGVARRPQAWYDLLSSGVYAGVGAALRGTASALRVAERRGVGPRLESRPAGRHVLSAVNGLIGDRLEADRPELAIKMSVRSGGTDVPPTSEALADAFPEATERVVVFVHGLGENDDWWRYRSAEVGGTYGDRLSERGRWTPVYVRANTGLTLAENGAALASLMTHLVTSWPTDVQRIALVGHSMGGLIVRAACAVEGGGTEGSRGAWTDMVTDVVTLGTPHLGAPLEHLVHAGARVLGVLPESAPIGRILEYRSVGILDLRRGLAADVRHLEHARYRLVAATVARSHRHPVSEVLGDLLVRYPSAVGRPRRGSPMFPGAEVLHVPGVDHFELLNSPAVADALERWLA